MVIAHSRSQHDDLRKGITAWAIGASAVVLVSRHPEQQRRNKRSSFLQRRTSLQWAAARTIDM